MGLIVLVGMVGLVGLGGFVGSCGYGRNSRFESQFRKNNTIKAGGSTAPYTAYTVDTIFTLFKLFKLIFTLKQ